MKKTLGEKIKNFRKRAGLTQIDLEDEINASPGAISRIESNKVNPTKETLTKIADALKLKPVEVTQLLGLNVHTAEELIMALNRISQSLDLKKTLQTAVDILYDIYPDFNGGMILLIDESNPDRVYTESVTNVPEIMNILNKYLPFNIIGLETSIKANPDNYIVKTILTKTYQQSFDICNFTRNVFPSNVCKYIQKLLNYKSGISFPLIYKNNVIGVILYTKRIRDDFKNDIKALSLLSDNIANLIGHVQTVMQLKKEIQTLKKEIDLYKKNL